MLSTQASSAQIKPLAFTIHVYSDWLDVRQPASSCVLQRVAHFVAEVSCFATKFTLCSQVLAPFRQ